MNEHDKKLNDRILSLITEKNETGYSLEKNSVITNGTVTITHWKNYRQKPSIEAIVKLAKYFNVSSDYLLGLPLSPIQKLYDKMNNAQKEEMQIFARALLGIKASSEEDEDVG